MGESKITVQSRLNVLVAEYRVSLYMVYHSKLFAPENRANMPRAKCVRVARTYAS